jgi:superfamily I DNA/RNA helicase
MNLNSEQIAAVKAKENKVVVIAAPAAGKTRVLTERIKYLIENGVAAKEIVAITFTNLAAYEMRSRLDMLENTEIFIGTIHSYANRILLANGIDTQPDIEKSNFDNLLIKALPTYLARPRVTHLLVDESQDLGDLEYDFLMSIPADSLYFVADDDQAIYAFKGSNVNILLGWIKDPSYKVYTLDKNYRNGSKILDFSRRLLKYVKKSYPKVIMPMSTKRGRVVECNYKEAIDDLVDDGHYSNWFILTRTNKEIEMIAEYLTELQVPYITFKRKDLTLEEIESYISKDAVKLLTIHTSKGLESENVIVVGANFWNDDECRVAYVGATRAKNNLYWCPSCGQNRGKRAKSGKFVEDAAMIDFSKMKDTPKKKQKEMFIEPRMMDGLTGFCYSPTDEHEDEPIISKWFYDLEE